MSLNEVSPVFVVGMNGSGTTMLADSLGHHPQLYMLPFESKVLPYYLKNQEKFGSLDTLEGRRGMARQLGGTKAFWQANGKRNVVLPDEVLTQPGFAGVVDPLYRHYANWEGKARWGDKSPINTRHIVALGAAFPDAQFIHIIRDGRDSAQSFHRRWRYDPMHTITRWKSTVKEGRKQGRALGEKRYLEVHYESLTMDPESEMKKICHFLGLPFDEAVLTSSMHWMDPSNKNAQARRIIPNSGKWREYFSAAQLKEFEDIAGETLAECGYEVSVRGDREATQPMRWYWIVKDGLSYTRWFFGSYGLQAFPMYFRAGANALRQFLAGRQ